MPAASRTKSAPTLAPPRGGGGGKRGTHPASSPSGNAVASSVASKGSGSDEEDDEDDEDEEDEDEDIEDDDDENEKTGFDENFLAQLMAMDPLLGNGSLNFTNGKDIVLPDVSTQAAGFVASDANAVPRDTGNANGASMGALQHNAAFPNMPAYASAASTPSNEFYDGAINFLTEVLGSTDPTLWDASAPLSKSQEPNPVWGGNASLQATSSAASPAPTQAQFKSLQPLIGNLIARLKGQPVEEIGQAPRVQEEDLVVLLQTLMAQRQAQSERKVQQHTEGDLAQTRKGAQTRHTQNQTQNVSTVTTDKLQPAGFSIVDFDFGEDDDDPDFDPGRINLDFGNSDEFARALAEVTKETGTNATPSNPTGDLQANDKAWQQMFDAFNAQGGNIVQASPGGAGRRTRSTSKHGEQLNATSPSKGEGTSARPQLKAPSTEEGESVHDEDDDDDDEEDSLLQDGSVGAMTTDGAALPRKRKAYSAEEALERRREANRECARRQRAKKKQETEQARVELERIRALHGGADLPSEAILEATRSLISKRKRGRPLGSQNRRTIEENERDAAQAAEAAALADLRAENRFMCAEMHKLREENAQLRARVLRHEELFESLGKHDLVKRLAPALGMGRGTSVDDRGDYYDEEEDEEEDEEDEHYRRGADQRYVKRPALQDPASQFLAYDPFREALRGRGDGLPNRATNGTRSGQRLTRPGRQRVDDPGQSADIWQRQSGMQQQQQQRGMRDASESIHYTSSRSGRLASHDSNHIRNGRPYDILSRGAASKGDSERALHELLRAAAANEMS